jgi:hypothetical protein
VFRLRRRAFAGILAIWQGTAAEKPVFLAYSGEAV